MLYYFAPLEGLTDSTYRALHRKYFPGIDRYYTPFLSPTVHRQLTPREKRELAFDPDCPTVPQLLTKNPEDFLWMARQCRDLGFTEVNLNLGCPSGTVTAKGKGAGMLADPEGLDRFLDAVFSDAPLSISVKTRIGFRDSGEFPALLDIFNRYPIKELTVHPRVRAQFYNGAVDTEAFGYAAENSRAPLCYNGNICSKKQADALPYPAVMVGRALIADPGMFTPGGTQRDPLEAFITELTQAYIENFGGPRNAMFRMKEHWRHLLCNFEDAEALGKRLRKTTDLAQYQLITGEIFARCPLRRALQPDW